MAILRKLVVPTLVTVAAVQYFRSSSSSNPAKPNNKHMLENEQLVDSFPHPGRLLANAFRTASYSLRADLVNPWSIINRMAYLMNSVQVGGSRKWKLKETAEAVVLQVDLSDVAGDVKVSVVQNTDIDGRPTKRTLVVKEHGVCRREPFYVSPEDQKFVTIFGDSSSSILVNHPAVLIIEHKGSEDSRSSRWLLDLPYNVYNNNAIKIEEKNKMLQVTIPKLKPMWINEMDMVQQPI